MASKGNSIAAVASRALGVERKLLPERLRDRLNYYVKNESLKNRLLSEPDFNSEANKYTPRPIRTGSCKFVRNLVVLDTLFNDYGIVTKCLNDDVPSKEALGQFFAEWRAKKMLYQALESNLPALEAFFTRDNIDWEQDEVPYPFSDGDYSSVDLITKVIMADNNPSPYDCAIKAVITNQFEQLGQILDHSPEHFVSVEGQWLVQLYQAKCKEYKDFYELLNKYN
ncbi:hypothetical protein ACRWQM_02780 [Shewanella sp. HL-SH5]|uniref:hypothetical protein n=1 Tax=Shewanella sp. HL-SH5 TaxID=3436241 RepID=UPI003EB89815